MARADDNLRVLHVISGDLWAGAEVQAYTLLSQLKTQCQLKVVLMNPGRLHDECVALGLDVVLCDERALKPWQILGELRGLIRGFKPDIIHTHRQKENILGTLAGYLAGYTRSVRTSHGASEFRSRGLRRLQVGLEYVITRYLQSGVIAVSDDLAHQLKTRFPARHIHTIHNGIDADSLQLKAGGVPLFTDPGIHIGIIGRLEPVKRVDLFLETIAQVRASRLGHPIHCHVIGDGGQWEKLQSLTKALSLDDSVRFHGHRSDVPRCLASLDLLVMPSDHEGTPMVVLEALALGTPVLAHNVGGLKEILHQYPQLLVDDHSVSGYAEAITKLLPDIGRMKVSLENRYRASQNAESTLALYHKLTR